MKTGYVPSQRLMDNMVRWMHYAIEDFNERQSLAMVTQVMTNSGKVWCLTGDKFSTYEEYMQEVRSRIVEWRAVARLTSGPVTMKETEDPEAAWEDIKDRGAMCLMFVMEVVDLPMERWVSRIVKVGNRMVAQPPSRQDDAKDAAGEDVPMLTLVRRTEDN